MVWRGGERACASVCVCVQVGGVWVSDQTSRGQTHPVFFYRWTPVSDRTAFAGLQGRGRYALKPYSARPHGPLACTRILTKHDKVESRYGTRTMVLIKSATVTDMVRTCAVSNSDLKSNVLDHSGIGTPSHITWCMSLPLVPTERSQSRGWPAAEDNRMTRYASERLLHNAQSSFASPSPRASRPAGTEIRQEGNYRRRNIPICDISVAAVKCNRKTIDKSVCVGRKPQVEERSDLRHFSSCGQMEQQKHRQVRLWRKETIRGGTFRSATFQ
ncbi:hypothetical protein J6590_050095 [Homalodisca vitripennis]|nr:hypothetical protein J6590_050095 [Homalodisca vitripennis]